MLSATQLCQSNGNSQWSLIGSRPCSFVWVCVWVDRLGNSVSAERFGWMLSFLRAIWLWPKQITDWLKLQQLVSIRAHGAQVIRYTVFKSQNIFLLLSKLKKLNGAKCYMQAARNQNVMLNKSVPEMLTSKRNLDTVRAVNTMTRITWLSMFP